MFENEKEWGKLLFGIAITTIIGAMFVAIVAMGMTIPQINPPMTEHNHRQIEHARYREPMLER
ncbi:MAG: hypothetical protein FWG63_03010 [Defluviitaleaceae bacterium]|nr:hypothetical protein [Defluviitaleaceae bacterium]